jgi:tetratricopeptide (TPR) repeat protein
MDEEKSARKAMLRAIADADENDEIAYTRHLCERFLKEEPNHAPTLIRYARNLISLAQYSAAKDAIDRAESFAPKERMHLVVAQSGHLLEAQGEFESAEKEFMRAHHMRLDDADYLIFAAGVAFRRGDLERAETLARESTKCTEGCIHEAWFNLGGYLLSSQKYAEAKECYHRALEIDPEYDIAKKRLKDVELVLKDIDSGN